MDEYSAPLREEGDRPVVTFGVGRYSGRQELTGRRSQWSGTALWPRRNWRRRWCSHRGQVLSGARRWHCPGAPGGLGT